MKSIHQTTTSMLVLAALGVAGSASAQIQTPASSSGEEAIVVTGSRIARADANSVGPLTTLTADDIASVAPTSAGDLLQSLPSVGVSLNSNGTQGTSFGVSSINLRYLGGAEGSGNRTLVLVDGHRWANAAGGRGFRDFVDLNTIPLGLIDRVEVLKDGASAIYGADAIAGVVNIHTKTKLEGIEASARIGATDRNDNENYSGYINWGRSFDRASVMLSASYNKTRPILTSDRPLTARALTPLTAAPTSPRGLFVLPGLTGNAYFGTPTNFGNSAANAITRLPGVTSIGAATLADESFRVARLPDDDYNTMTQGLYATGPSDRYGLFARFGYEVSDTVKMRVEALYNNRTSSQLFSPVLLDVRGSNGFAISADQAFNPFGTANGVPLANALAFTGSTFRAQRVMEEVGNRDNRQNVDTYRAAVGFEGELNLMGAWRWDSFFSYSKNKATFDAVNQVNLENVYRALLSPAACASSAGCVPLNIFGTITPSMADYIRFNGHDENGTSQYDFSVNASRELGMLPGGPLGLAVGYEYRKESAYDRPDAFASALSGVLPLSSGARQLPTTAQSRDVTTGAYDLHEGYVELSAPLLADLPLVHSLDVDAAVRFSQYSTVGGKATSKLGVAYRPVRDVLLRGTFSQGFRAPSILELYQGQRQTNFQGVDPCNGGGTGKPGCAGVPSSYNQSQFNGGLIAGVTAGNTALRPETAETFSAGFALTPSFLPGFSATLDWFRINVKDAISAQTASQILTSCATSQIFCELVRRETSGEIKQLTQAVVNLSRIEVEGVDAAVRYRFSTPIGTFEPAIDVAYLSRYRTRTPQPDGSVLIDDRAGKSDQPRSTFPRWKGQASVRYDLDNVSANWKIRYIGKSSDIPGNAVNGGTITDVFYHDAQLSYDFADTDISLSLGVDNVFDRQPPASAANNPINFDIYTYDIRGRYGYMRLGVRF